LKHGKKPTKAQKIFLTSCRLNHKNWLIIRDSLEVIEIVHRLSGKTRKFVRSVYGK